MDRLILRTIILLLIAYTPVYAQHNGTVEIRNGDTVGKYIDRNAKYLFDEFSNGTVVYKDGKAEGKLNYNCLVEEMEFINPATDSVMALANLQNVDTVIINNTVFIKSGIKASFLQLLTRGDYCLGVLKSVTLNSIGTKAAYGTVNATTANGTTSDYSTSGRNLNLGTNRVYNIKKEEAYYIVHGHDKKPVRSIKSIIKFFPSAMEESIRQYDEENNLNIKKQSDLIKLVNYCNTHLQ